MASQFGGCQLVRSAGTSWGAEHHVVAVVEPERFERVVVGLLERHGEADDPPRDLLWPGIEDEAVLGATPR